MNRTEPPPPSPLAFGATMLLDLFEGERDAVTELLGAAVGMIEDDVKRIEGACEQNDPHALAEAAHSLKGASASIGCASVSTVSAAIERIGNSGSCAVEAPLAELREATAALVADISEFVVSGSPLGV